MKENLKSHLSSFAINPEKPAVAKWFRYILSIILILVIVFSVIGYKQSSANLERQSRTTLKQLLSCTLQQAEDFDAAAETTPAAAESAADSGTGLFTKVLHWLNSSI